MKLTVKNLKVMKSLSEETLCFSADFYVDGVKAFAASNRGCGGCNDYHAYDKELMEKFEAWCKDQPNEPSEYFEDGLEFDIDLAVENAIEVIEVEKDVKRILKKIAFKNGKDIMSYNVPPDHATIRDQIKAKFPDAIVLNDVPFEKAVELYRAM